MVNIASNSNIDHFYVQDNMLLNVAFHVKIKKGETQPHGHAPPTNLTNLKQIATIISNITFYSNQFISMDNLSSKHIELVTHQLNT